jgi:DNA-directed RNA polymerase specialized sigma subunit
MNESEQDMQVKLYNKNYIINKKTRKSYNTVIKVMNNAINKIVNYFYINGLDKEDFIQEVHIIIINGIDAYDISAGTQLSTFLHIHMRNKVISLMSSKLVKSKKPKGSILSNFTDEDMYKELDSTSNEYSIDPTEDIDTSCTLKKFIDKNEDKELCSIIKDIVFENKNRYDITQDRKKTYKYINKKLNNFKAMDIYKDIHEK